MLYNPDKPPTIDCQDCGDILKELTPEQAKQVAENPYNFVFYCRICAPSNIFGDL